VSLEMAPATLDVLYVHPGGHPNDLVIPAGALTCMNAARGTRLGRYAVEVTDDEIAAARVVAIDVHWALALPGFERLVTHVRAVSCGATIIVGGVTAGHYARELLERYPIDYVISGDPEASFAALVDALRAGARPTDLPNVHARDLPPPAQRRLTAAEYDATDPLTADWFPTCQRVGRGRVPPRAYDRRREGLPAALPGVLRLVRRDVRSRSPQRGSW